jgi:hypothetical protein
MRARFAVAILLLALVYASTCSATCAICLSAEAAAATQSHECGHAAPDAAGGSHEQRPARPDCFGHHHSSFEIVQGDGLSRFQLSATGYASHWFDGVVSAEAFSVTSSFSWDLAPPRLTAIFPQQNNSILRI